ncbi:MAG: hypothetical protein HY674_02165 [Chloroflexi bacterium]|nr:hypothetical protein [Chloroflexota bacterium]
MHATKSGVIGLIAAAMGIDKQATDEPGRIGGLAKLSFICFAPPTHEPRNGCLGNQRIAKIQVQGFKARSSVSGNSHPKPSVKQPEFRERRHWLAVRRLEDYHTVEGTRRASGKLDEGTVQTYRQYLLDARFAVLLARKHSPWPATAERPVASATGGFGNLP